MTRPAGFLWGVVIALCLIALVFLLAACGSDPKPSAAKRPAPTATPRRCPALCIGEQLALANPTKPIAVQCLTPEGMSPGLVGVYLCAVQIGSKCQTWMVAPDGLELLNRGPGPCPIPAPPQPTGIEQQ